MTFQPKYEISNRITTAFTHIERARGFLDAAHLSQKWLNEMQQKAFLLEAHHTTHIEGTQLTLEQSKKILEGKKVQGTNPDDAQELLNYRSAFELVAKYLGDGGPLTEGLIRQVHKILVTGVRGDEGKPGEYRHTQNYVVNSVTREVIYTPPPPFEVHKMIADLVKWLNDTQEVHPILLAGIAQFQFVHIHPFVDGNGRTARLLSTLILYKKGYDFKKLFTISEYYDRNRTDYYHAIQSVRENEMDMTGWLEYFSIGLSTQMKEIADQGEVVVKASLEDRKQMILDCALKEGSIDIKKCEELFPDVNRRTLQRELKEMVEQGSLQVEGETNNRIYKPLK